MSESWDFVVLGSGPAGQKAAICAAKAGKRVLVVDREPAPGGACVHHGTIPSKTLRETALAMVGLARRTAGAFTSRRETDDVAPLLTRVSEVVAGHEKFIADQLSRNDVTLVHGHARFLGPGKIEITRRAGDHFVVEADHTIIAVGSRPREPRGIAVDHEHVFDSDSILSMSYLPRTMAVLGGGVVASEYASIFSSLGVEITMIDTGPRPMPFLDSELTTCFVEALERRGGRYLPGRRVLGVHADDLGKCAITLEGEEPRAFEKVFSALGRVANVEGLGLEAAGVTLTARGVIAVDDSCRTVIPRIYAVGDVAGPPSLASSAMEQGRRAVRHALGLPLNDPRAAGALPFCAYTIPEIASVGLSEEEARARHGDVVVGRAPFNELARAHIAALAEGMIKVVADADGRKILGVQVVGEGAAELVHVGQMALVGRFDVDMLIETTFNFPTLAEGYRVAGLDIAKQRPR